MSNLNSLAFRSRLAGLVSPLRRVRPRVPFYQLAAHRIPTLWTLYRGLLRHAPGKNTRFRITMLFRKYKNLTGVTETRKQLDTGHKWLEIFIKAKEGDTRLQLIAGRYERMIGARREKERWKYIIKKAFTWQHKLSRRPIMTGLSIRPTIYNQPLPRLTPQPLHISMMIFKRRQARQRRGAAYAHLKTMRDDLLREVAFEANLTAIADQPFVPVFDNLEDWIKPIQEQEIAIRKTFDLELKRLLSPYPPQLLDALKRARRDKVENKTRERQRERRGEILSVTLRRRRKGPPAHVLANMTPEQRKMDKIARSPSSAGYVRLVKEQLGFRVRDNNIHAQDATS